jgi:hypothetical protein
LLATTDDQGIYEFALTIIKLSSLRYFTWKGASRAEVSPRWSQRFFAEFILTDEAVSKDSE